MSNSVPLLNIDAGAGQTTNADPLFDAKCRRVTTFPAEMADSLKYTFVASKITSPSSESLPPQPISSMGQPNIDAVFKVGSKQFFRKQGGWKGDKSNPDDKNARQARLMKFFEAAYRSSDGGDRAGLTPEMQDVCLPNDKVVAVLNCVEVIGMPDSPLSSSEGFIQAAIIERDGSVKTRRLVIIASAGNASIDATETMSQMFQVHCCGLCPNTEVGSKYFNYGVKVQEHHELSIINIHNSVVHVGVTKKTAKDYRASSSGAGTGKVVRAKCCGLGDCCQCPSCDCNCCQCGCWDKCFGSRYFRCIALESIVALDGIVIVLTCRQLQAVSFTPIWFHARCQRRNCGGALQSACCDDSCLPAQWLTFDTFRVRPLQGSTGSSIFSGDGEACTERWITASDENGIRKTVRIVWPRFLRLSDPSFDT